MIQDWWNDLTSWLMSVSGWRTFTGAILPFIAILAGGLIAGLIARGAVKRLLRQQDRQHKAAAIAALIAAARRATFWSSLNAAEQDHVEYQSSEAETRVRMLPVAGADLAADWAAHYLRTLKQHATSLGSSNEQDFNDLQDGLIQWHHHPRRARKLFAQDLAAWKYDAPEDPLVIKQRQWAAQQAASPTEPLVAEKA